MIATVWMEVNPLWSILEEQVEGRSLVQMLSLIATDTSFNGRSGKFGKCGPRPTEDVQLPGVCSAGAAKETNAFTASFCSCKRLRAKFANVLVYRFGNLLWRIVLFRHGCWYISKAHERAERDATSKIDAREILKGVILLIFLPPHLS